MFPDSDTIYVVHELRRRESLREETRTRIAATAAGETGPKRTPRHAASAHLQGVLIRVGALMATGSWARHISSTPVPQCG